MFFHVLKSELTKLTTTASLYWTTGLYLLFSVGFSALTALSIRLDPSHVLAFGPQALLVLVYMLGVFILAIQAVIVVTNEYSHHYQSATFLATPKRWVVIVAKWLLYAVYAAILTFVAIVLCLYVAKAVVGGAIGASLDVFGDAAARRALWLYPVQAVLYVTVAQAVAWLTRQTAAGVAFMLMVPLVVESILGALPKIGQYIYFLMPFSNLNAFINKVNLRNLWAQDAPPWGWEFGIWYFLIWAVVLAGAAVVVVEKRDA
ncbi:MAG: ABC transporter permease [Corynebacterium sp.]|nr:ABC transporter permease [Corynebacterium sp.]